jgi:hypothetical protein
MIANLLNLFISQSNDVVCVMLEVSRVFYAKKDAHASISKIKDSIYRISDLVPD